eukprot:9073786-Alexandrium_andersonii.AAC.1
MHDAASSAFDTAPGARSGTFVHVRALSSSFGRNPKLPEAARQRPTAPDNARKCSRHVRSVPKAPEIVVCISCYAFGALRICNAELLWRF